MKNFYSAHFERELTDKNSFLNSINDKKLKKEILLLMTETLKEIKKISSFIEFENLKEKTLTETNSMIKESKCDENQAYKLTLLSTEVLFEAFSWFYEAKEKDR